MKTSNLQQLSFEDNFLHDFSTIFEIFVIS